MEIDAGVIVGLVFLAGFIAAIVWAEVYNRRQRRNRVEDTPPSVPPAPPAPGRRARPRA